MEYFDYYKALWHKRIPFKELPTDQNHYGILRLVSMHSDGLGVAQAVTELPTLPNYAVAAILYYGLPECSIGFKTLPKKTKAKKRTKKQDRHHEKIRAKYCVNDVHAAQILRIYKKLKVRLGE